MLEPRNGDVLVEPPSTPFAKVAFGGAAAVIVVGSLERATFGHDVEAARAYASRQARHRGTRALLNGPDGYTLISIE